MHVVLTLFLISAITVTLLCLCLGAARSVGAARAKIPALPNISLSQLDSCGRLMRQLPPKLNGMPIGNAPAPRIAVWGKRKILVACGVARPSDLTVTSQYFRVGVGSELGVNWIVNAEQTMFTAVDRAVFISLSVVPGNTPDLPAISEGIAQNFAQVCTSIDDQQAGQQLPLCTGSPS